jgi:hypothetical protein
MRKKTKTTQFSSTVAQIWICSLVTSFREDRVDYRVVDRFRSRERPPSIPTPVFI